MKGSFNYEGLQNLFKGIILYTNVLVNYFKLSQECSTIQ